MGDPPLALVLASASPRRRILLEQLGLVFEVRSADLDETPGAGERAEDLALRLASEKAAAVVRPGEVAIAADTVVALDGELLGKPVDATDAGRMLSTLSGRTHQVTTGVAVRVGADQRALAATTAVTTQVQFVDLDDDTIDWYVRHGEPFDKAGGYGLQGGGGHLIRSINGSPTNVIGLPLAETIELAGRVGIDLRWFRGRGEGAATHPPGGDATIP